MRVLIIWGSVVSILLMIVAPVFAQAEDETFFEEDDLLVEGAGIVVEITVEVEKPMVIVEPMRQKPIIEAGTLQTPIETMIHENISSLKPNPADVKILKIEKPQIMLAKER
ncbi:MAG: hypothetical protein P9M15_08075 [Candidatus Electryoneaceae bacterium]|nr:hypothetical protein [Candidatus Electryoneaceae bacterium]